VTRCLGVERLREEKTMIAAPRPRCVADLLEMCEMNARDLIEQTGLPPEIVQAIVAQRYTPSPVQRQSVSAALGVSHEQIIWGHRQTVEPAIHSPD
jgi:hypothetical protein